MITGKKMLCTQYAVDIPMEKIREIIAKDSASHYPLYGRLSNIRGLSEVTYDEHFGPHIYFVLSTDEDTKETWDLIIKAIENYL